MMYPPLLKADYSATSDRLQQLARARIEPRSELAHRPDADVRARSRVLQRPGPWPAGTSRKVLPRAGVHQDGPVHRDGPGLERTRRRVHRVRHRPRGVQQPLPDRHLRGVHLVLRALSPAAAGDGGASSRGSRPSTSWPMQVFEAIVVFLGIPFAAGFLSRYVGASEERTVVRRRVRPDDRPADARCVALYHRRDVRHAGTAPSSPRRATSCSSPCR